MMSRSSTLSAGPSRSDIRVDAVLYTFPQSLPAKLDKIVADIQAKGLRVVNFGGGDTEGIVETDTPIHFVVRSVGPVTLADASSIVRGAISKETGMLDTLKDFEAAFVDQVVYQTGRDVKSKVKKVVHDAEIGFEIVFLGGAALIAWALSRR